jgi:hypothetical protein
MDNQSKTEIKASKLVNEALAKIKALNGTAATPPETEERLKEILTNLALRSALAGLPDKCKECDSRLDSRLRDRCPKHVGLLLAADFAKKQAREHGPALAAKAAMGFQAWLEKFSSAGGSESEEKTEEEKA